MSNCLPSCKHRTHSRQTNDRRPTFANLLRSGSLEGVSAASTRLCKIVARATTAAGLQGNLCASSRLAHSRTASAEGPMISERTSATSEVGAHEDGVTAHLPYSLTGKERVG